MSAAWLPELRTGMCAVKECSCEAVAKCLSICFLFKRCPGKKSCKPSTGDGKTPFLKVWG